MQGVIVILIFIITSLIVFLEKYLGRYKLPIYVFLGLSLILVAGFREIGVDADSLVYESIYNSNMSADNGVEMEFSFSLLASIMHLFTDDVHGLFLLYAILGITLKFIAFRNLSVSWFMPVIVFISYYFEYHDCMEIRTSILSAFMLLAIKPLAEGKKLYALLLIIMGGFFHYSAIMLIPLFFLSNKPMSIRQKIFWGLCVPVGYLLHFGGSSLLLNVSSNIPYIGERIETYQNGAIWNILQGDLNIFAPLHLFMIMLFYYLLFFQDVIIENNKYYPIMMKICAIGMFAFPVLSIVPVFAQRVSMQYFVVNIILYATLQYTLKPKWVGALFVIAVSFVLLNYSLPEIGTHIFWGGGDAN
jgi:hypothetical protein